MRNSHNSQRFVQFRRGDRDALEFYYVQYVDQICFYLQESIGDRIMAVTLTEGVFVALYQVRQRVKNEEQLRQFLYGEAQRLSRQYLRENGRLKAYEANPSYDVGTPAHLMEKAKAEMLVAFRASAFDLSGRNRMIVLLYCFYDKSVTEIAKKLNIDVETVKQYLTQQIVFLRKSSDGRWEEFNPLIT